VSAWRTWAEVLFLTAGGGTVLELRLALEGLGGDLVGSVSVP
jgi:hypothetical protein